jgi:hypothetical protein
MKHLTPEYIANYVKKLAWLEQNPVKLTHISDALERHDAWRIDKQKVKKK